MRDFKSLASTDFAIRAGGHLVRKPMISRDSRIEAMHAPILTAPAPTR